MKKMMVVGNGGRESIFATKFAEDSQVFAVMKHENPTIAHFVKKTGGSLLIGDTNDGPSIADFSEKHAVDYVFVSADEPLSKGVVDCLLDRGIRCVGPSRAGAEIEWNKAYATDLMAEEFPEHVGAFWNIESEAELTACFRFVTEKNMPIVVKPVGLTGGKGVKVMGEHLKSFDEAKAYASSCLAADSSVIVTEKLEGVEFTIMGLTDGETLLYPPITIDYPFRFEGDTGPGTGGMGSFSDVNRLPSFMTADHDATCKKIMKGILARLKKDKRLYNGVLNAGFFLTQSGIKFMEFNARFGDPESMNTLSVFGTSFSDFVVDVYHKRLHQQSAMFEKRASLVLYLVTPEYSVSKGKTYTFTVDVDGLKRLGVSVCFSAAVHVEGTTYQTVGNSRTVALIATDDTVQACAKRIHSGIEQCVQGDLDYRRDIGLQTEAVA